ncbi:TPA: chemotaxis protein CheB [Vibrio cholerae]|jgi:two-component system chemotaxis response regulator CheB
MSQGIVVIGASAGGLAVISRLWAGIVGRIPWPVVLVQHIGVGGDVFLARHLNQLHHQSHAAASVAQSFSPLKPGQLYIAPVNYHLLVESKTCLSLSIDPPEHYCRPAIDPLFMSASRVFSSKVIAIILTGANADGAAGCARVETEGGQVMIQAPSSAEVPIMPQAALDACSKAFVGDIDELVIELLRRLS